MPTPHYMNEAQAILNILTGKPVPLDEGSQLDFKIIQNNAAKSLSRALDELQRLGKFIGDLNKEKGLDSEASHYRKELLKITDAIGQAEVALGKLKPIGGNP